MSNATTQCGLDWIEYMQLTDTPRSHPSTPIHRLLQKPGPAGALVADLMAPATAPAATTDGGGWKRRRRRPWAAAAVAAAPGAVADVEACEACVEMAVQGHAALLHRLLVRQEQQQETKQKGKRSDGWVAEMAAWKGACAC